MAQQRRCLLSSPPARVRAQTSSASCKIVKHTLKTNACVSTLSIYKDHLIYNILPNNVGPCVQFYHLLI